MQNNLLLVLFLQVLSSSPYIFFSIYSLLSPPFLSLCWSAVGASLGSQPNRILLVTIHQLVYPITVDVLHQVFSPHGLVEKIVTFQKSAGQLLQVLLSYLLSFLFHILSFYVELLFDAYFLCWVYIVDLAWVCSWS